MKHLSQQMLSTELRQPHLRKRRRELRQSLSSPSLTEERRRVVRRDLENIGKPKIYDDTDPAPVGALPNPDSGPVVLDLEDVSHDTLVQIAHTTLFTYALQQGLPVLPGNTKAQIVTTILANTKGENNEPTL